MTGGREERRDWHRLFGLPPGRGKCFGAPTFSRDAEALRSGAWTARALRSEDYASRLNVLPESVVTPLTPFLFLLTSPNHRLHYGGGDCLVRMHFARTDGIGQRPIL